ncbi:MaoC family dehydratase N-terminal domain-containing protein [Chloroflexota bacterium]
MLESKEARMAEGLITEEMLEEMRGKIGLKLRIEHSIWNEEATRLAIKKFADGIGDHNPLWSDTQYAGRTRYGSIVAPPSWVISVFAAVQFGWKGLGGFHNASDIELYKPVFLNDKITPESIFTGFEGPKHSEFAEKIVIDFYDNNYYNQRGELVAKIRPSYIRAERATARKKGKYRDIQLPHPWTEDELRALEEEVLAEEIRGSDARYWEDVEIGDELKPLVKGPIGLTDEIAFLVGGGAPIPRLTAHGVALRSYRKHPAWAFRDPNSHALEPIFAVHYNKEAAKAMGLPLQYDVGFQRQCWQIHLLTNWMGDEGWLKKTYAQYRKFVYHSDVVWVKGKVTKKYIDADGEPCVDVETRASNQRGEEVMPGRATIVLPSREKATSPLDSRLPK